MGHTQYLEMGLAFACSVAILALLIRAERGRRQQAKLMKKPLFWKATEVADEICDLTGRQDLIWAHAFATKLKDRIEDKIRANGLEMPHKTGTTGTA